MKRIIFLILMAVSAIGSNAQTKHLNLSQCKNDGFLYIEANYIHNAQRCIGQTVYEFARELELDIEPSQITVGIYTAWEGVNMELNQFFTGLTLKFYYNDLMYSVSLELEPPFLYGMHNMPQIVQSNDTQWSEIYNGIFKSNKIKDIWVMKKRNGVWVTETYDRARDYFYLRGQALQDFLNQ